MSAMPSPIRATSSRSPSRSRASAIGSPGSRTTFELTPPLYWAGDPCAANPDIDKGGTAFGFASCERGGGCERLRAIVVALDNVDPIADGAVLYRCRIAIDDDAPAGSYPIAATNAGASDPEGNALVAAALSGRVVVGSVSTALVRVDDAAIRLGVFSPISVRLVSGGGASQVGVDLALSDALHILSDAEGHPKCGAALPDVTGAFAFEPDGCSADSGTCVIMRATIGSVDPLPSDAALFECALFPVPVIDPGSYAVDCTADATAPDGAAVAAFCLPGTLQMLGRQRRPTATLVPSPSSGASPIPPTGFRASPTPTAAARRTTTVVPAAVGTDDDGCQVGPPGSQAALACVPPAIWLLWRRRRRAPRRLR